MRRFFLSEFDCAAVKFYVILFLVNPSIDFSHLFCHLCDFLNLLLYSHDESVRDLSDNLKLNSSLIPVYSKIIIEFLPI